MKLTAIACLAIKFALVLPLYAQERPPILGNSSTIKEFDKNEDGTLCDEELNLVTQLTTLRRTMGPFDLDGDGRLNIVEARAWYASQHQESDAPVAVAGWRFHEPVDIAITSGGDLVVADAAAHVIWKIGVDGKAQIWAGRESIAGAEDGPQVNATFNAPRGVACGPDGSIFVSDTGNGTIRKISPDGAVTTYAGTASTDNNGSKDGNIKEATFWTPGRLACDNKGNLYVTQPNSGLLRRITTEGEVSTLPLSLYRFENPIDVSVCNNGVVYVVDGVSAPEGRLIAIVGRQASKIGDKFIIGAVDTNNEGRAIVADLHDNKIFNVTSNGEYSDIIPKGMTFEGAIGYALAASNERGVFVLTRKHLYHMRNDGVLELVMQSNN